MEVITEFIAKATVKVWAYIYDEDDTLVDPTSVTVTITDPDGTVVVNAEAMTQSETGIYYYYYRTTTSSTKGNYAGEVDVTDGSGELAIVTPVPFSFKVK